MSALKHVGVLSVAKMTALFGLLFGIIHGILISVFAVAFVTVMSVLMPVPSGPGAAGVGLGAIVIILFAIGGAVIGFLGGAILAFLYNVFAGWVGGIELDLG